MTKTVRQRKTRLEIFNTINCKQAKLHWIHHHLKYLTRKRLAWPILKLRGSKDAKGKKCCLQIYRYAVRTMGVIADVDEDKPKPYLWT